MMQIFDAISGKHAAYAYARSALVCLAGIGATFAMVAVGAYADSMKIGGTGLGTMESMAQVFNRSKPDAQLILTPSLGCSAPIAAVHARNGNLALRE